MHDGEVLEPQESGEPEDLAADIRRANPYLPAVWAGGPGKNPAARNMAYRIGRYIKEGREVPLHEMQWFEKYGQALIYRKRKTTFTVEDEEMLSSPDGKITNQEIALQLLNMLVSIKRDHQDRIDRMNKEYTDRIDRVQERADGQNMEIIKLIQKDKSETIGLIQRAYGEANLSINANVKAVTPLIEALMRNNIGMVEHFGKVSAEYQTKTMELIKEVGKPGNIEMLIMMVLGPSIPVLLPALLSKMKIPVPADFVTTLTGIMKSVLIDPPK